MPQRVAQGATITLTSDYRDGSGSLVDPATPRVTIYNPAEVAVVTDAVPTKDFVGHYFYNYAVAGAAPLGLWRIHWTGVINGAPAEADDEYFEVVVPGFVETPSPWPTVDDLADYLGVTIEAGEMAHAQTALDGAKAAVQSYTRQRIESVLDETVTLRGTWEQELWLPQRPVTEVTEVTVTDSLGVVTPVTAFSWTRAGLLLNRGFLTATYGWGGPHAVVTVTYSHGFSSVPDVVRDVVLAMAARGMENPEGIQSDQVGDKAVSYFAGQATGRLNETEKDSLKDFRRTVASVRT